MLDENAWGDTTLKVVASTNLTGAIFCYIKEIAQTVFKITWICFSTDMFIGDATVVAKGP